MSAQEFDGGKDSLFQQFDAVGRRHMEYVNDRGTHADVPVAVRSTGVAPALRRQ